MSTEILVNMMDPGNAWSSRQKQVSILLGVAVAAAFTIGLSQYVQNNGAVGNDSTQYLVGAESLLDSHNYTTRILIFDEHYSSGLMPAPQTVWPPGVSTSIAAIGALGIPLELAGRIMSLLSYALLLGSLVLIVWYLTDSILAAAAAGIWQLVIVDMWGHSIAVGSDLAFTALMVVCVLVYIYNLHSREKHEAPGKVSFWGLATISLLAGIGFFFRYAGVFLIAWAMLLIFIELTTRVLGRFERIWVLIVKALAAAMPAVLVFVALTARNVLIIGKLRGGSNKSVENSILDLLTITAKELVTGLTGVNMANLFEAPMWLRAINILAVMFLGLLFFSALFRVWRLISNFRNNDWRAQASMMVVALIAIYTSGMIAVGSRTFIGFGTRYLIPVMPLCVILGMSLWNRTTWTLWAGIVVLGIAQFSTILNPSVASSGFSPSAYKPLSDLLARHTQPEEAIMAIGDGQRIGYYSNRPTLVVPTTKYSSAIWNEEKIRDMANTYGARFLFVGRTEDSSRYEPFAGSLINGDVAAWLERVQTFDTAFVYRVKLSN